MHKNNVIAADRAIIALIFLFIGVAVFPWSNGFGDNYFAHHRAIQTIVLLAVPVVIFCGGWRKSFLSAVDKKISLGAFLCFGGGAISVVLSESIPHALLEYLLWILLGVLWLGCASIRGARLARYTVYFFLLSHLCVIFLAVIYLGIALAKGDPVVAELIYPNVDNIRFFNQLQVLTFPFLLIYLNTPRWAGLAFLLFSTNVALLCIGGARGAFLVMVIILPLTFWLAPALRQQVVRGALACVLGVLAYGLLLWVGAEGMRDISRAGSSGRVEMWLEIIRGLGWHHLIWGEGPAHYVYFSDFVFGHPHNSVLQWLLEWGAISLVGLSIIVMHVFLRAVRYLQRCPHDLLVLGLFISWISALAYSLVDGVIVMPLAQTLLIIFMGLLWGQTCAEKVPSGAEATDGNIVSPFIHSVLAGVFVLVLTAPYVYLTSAYYLQQDDLSYGIKGPRFWINGSPLRLPERTE